MQVILELAVRTSLEVYEAENLLKILNETYNCSTLFIYVHQWTLFYYYR